jgi:uncharacterized protein YkwD
MNFATAFILLLVQAAWCKPSPSEILAGSGGSSRGGLLIPGCDGDFTAFQKDACNMHNELRARHGAPPLTLRADLCDYAQNWASTLATEQSFYHSNGQWGENLYATASSNPITEVDGITAVCNWYNEIKFYDFTTGTTTDPNEAIGHFTQVVWDETSFFGIGSACALPKDGWYWCYVAASYDKPGNWMGEYTQHVNVPFVDSTPFVDSC